MLLPDLPNEILLRVAWFLPKCPTCHCRHHLHDLFALSRCSHHLHSLLTPDLVRTASPMFVLLWAIWHNRPDTATKALALGANVKSSITEAHYVGRNTGHVCHGTPLAIAIRNRLRPMDPASRELAFEICALLLTAGGTPSIPDLGTIVDAEDTDLLRICIPRVRDINERTNPYGHTLLEVATTAGYDAAVALLVAAGASMEGTGQFMPSPFGAGVIVQVPMDGSGDFRVGYPAWDRSMMDSWDEWGPACMVPALRSGCMCPTCPREITGGYSVFK